MRLQVHCPGGALGLRRCRCRQVRSHYRTIIHRSPTRRRTLRRPKRAPWDMFSSLADIPGAAHGALRTARRAAAPSTSDVVWEKRGATQRSAIQLACKPSEAQMTSVLRPRRAGERLR